MGGDSKTRGTRQTKRREGVQLVPRDRGSVGVEKEMGTKMGITKMKKRKKMKEYYMGRKREGVHRR